MKAVITFKTIDNFGEKATCSLIESLDIPIKRIAEKLRKLESDDRAITGDITLQFVEEE